MRIDEALLRRRDKNELPEWESKGSLAEHLQLVHYDPGKGANTSILVSVAEDTFSCY